MHHGMTLRRQVRLAWHPYRLFTWANVNSYGQRSPGTRTPHRCTATTTQGIERVVNSIGTSNIGYQQASRC